NPVARQIGLPIRRSGRGRVHADAALSVKWNTSRLILRPLCRNGHRTHREHDRHAWDPGSHVDLLVLNGSLRCGGDVTPNSQAVEAWIENAKCRESGPRAYAGGEAGTTVDGTTSWCRGITIHATAYAI